jgi:hypothetical protein
MPNVFHRVYVYASAMSKNLVRDILQATYRVRHLIDHHMVYHVDPSHFGEHLPTNELHIRSTLDLKEHMMIGSMPTPPWLTDLRIRNVLELNVSVMHLEQLFQRYLRECNYVEQLDPADIKLQLELHTSTPMQYSYDDIPQLYPDDVYALVQKRIEGTIIPLEEAQLAKYHFQQLILDVSPAVKSVLWSLFIHQGQAKFRNLSYERALRNNAITLYSIRRAEKHAYRILNDAFSLRCEIIQDITNTLRIAHSHDFASPIGVEQLHLLSLYCQDNDKKIRTVFSLRFRRAAGLTDSGGRVRHATEVLNQILDHWGFSRLRRQQRKRKQSGGVQVDESVYRLESLTPPLGKQVYDHIRPAESGSFKQAQV